MQTTRWFRWLAAGVMVVPIAARAQGPQPIVKEIATIPGVYVEYPLAMPNGHVILFGADDSICAYDLATKHRVVVARGWDYDLVISPRGDRIAYARSAEDGDDYVWSLPIDPKTGRATGPAQRVSMSAGDSPSFSPDGKSIAFGIWRPKKGDLAVVPATGGPERIIAKYDHTIGGTYWSADGKWVYAEVGVARDTARTIERVPATGGRSESLFGYAHPKTNEGSLDGAIAFFRTDAGAEPQGRLAFATSTGRGEVRIPPGSTPDFSLRSAQSVLRRTSVASTLHLLTLADGKTKDLVLANVQAGEIRWSADGRQIAVIAGDEQAPDIVIMNADGAAARRYAIPNLAHGMQWSPDGRMIVYHQDGGKGLGLLDVASGKTRSLVSADRPFNGMGWRSDGKTILVESHTDGSGPNRPIINEVSLDGTVRLVRDLSADIPEVFSMGMLDDQTMAVLPRGNPTTAEFIVPLQGGPIRRLEFPRSGSGGARVEYATVAQHQAYVNLVTNNYVTGFEITSTSSGTARHASIAVIGERGPVNVMPDGEHVVLAGRTAIDTARKFYVVPLDGHAPREVAPAPGSLNRLSDKLSPDGKILAYTTNGTPTTELYRMDLTPVLQSVIKH